MLCFFSRREESVIITKGEFTMPNQDDLIIEQAKNGCNDAFESLFKKYLPIVLAQKRKYDLRDLELDDWLQEGRIICYQSLEKFDSTKNVTFGLFFKINFERHAITLLRYQEAQKRQINRVTDSLDSLNVENLTTASEDYKAKTSLEYIFVRESLEGFSFHLSLFEKSIFDCLLKGDNLTEISKKLDVPPLKVRSGYCRLKQKIKKQILE